MKHFTGIIALAVVGCADLPAPDEEVEVSEINGLNCEDFVCGDANSPEIDNKGLHELHLRVPTGTPEPRSGFKILEFRKGSFHYRPRVVGARLSGVPLDGGPAISNNSLKDAYFVIGAPTGKQYALKIDFVGSSPYWPRPNNVTYQMQWYRILWSDMENGLPIDKWKNVCSGPAPEYGPETLNLPVDGTVLFEGDRIDSVSKTVWKIDATDWMNIACAGTAIQKVHTSGYSTGADIDTGGVLKTTIQQRNALLAAYAAVYAGNGRTHTMAGIPLRVRDNGWLKAWPGDTKPEAAWAATQLPNGRWTGIAKCITEPRLEANGTPASKLEFPDIWKTIQESYGGTLPGECASNTTALIFTANPIQ